VKKAGVDERSLVYINMGYKYDWWKKVKTKQEHYSKKQLQLKFYRKKLKKEGNKEWEKAYPPPKRDWMF